MAACVRSSFLLLVAFTALLSPGNHQVSADCVCSNCNGMVQDFFVSALCDANTCQTVCSNSGCTAERKNCGNDSPCQGRTRCTCECTGTCDAGIPNEIPWCCEYAGCNEFCNASSCGPGTVRSGAPIPSSSTITAFWTIAAATFVAGSLLL